MDLMFSIEVKVKLMHLSLVSDSNQLKTNQKYYSYLVVITIFQLKTFQKMLLLSILVALVIKEHNMQMLFYQLQHTLKEVVLMVMLYLLQLIHKVEYNQDLRLLNHQDILEMLGKLLEHFHNNVVFHFITTVLINFVIEFINQVHIY